VVSVERASRTLTFRDPKGELRTVKVPQDVTHFSEIKPGDTITAKYPTTSRSRRNNRESPM
jgi:hypothetical protein